jgi:flagellar biosynthesis protein
MYWKTSKVKKAVALLYDRHIANAPQVKASGQGKIAEKIIEIAQQSGIPLYEDPDLVEVLSKIPIEEEIPPDLYKTVAEVLAFVYRVNKGYQKT